MKINQSPSLFYRRILHKHIELFSLWQKYDYPDKSLHALSLEILDEIERLDSSINIIAYKTALRNRKIAVPDRELHLAWYDLSSLKMQPNKNQVSFHLYLYCLHKKLFAILDNKKRVTYADACFLHYITSEIIEEYARLDPKVSTSSYRGEIAKLKAIFFESEKVEYN